MTGTQELTVVAGGGRLLHGTCPLAVAHIRTGWLRLLGCTIGLVGLVASVAASITSLYAAPDKRLAYAASIGMSPASAAFNGRPHDLETLGGIIANEVGFLGLLVFPLVAVHLVIRLTRTEEDCGRTELVTAGRLGRLAYLAAAALVVLFVLVVVVLGCLAVLVSFGLPVAGSFRYSAGLGLLGVAYAGVALVAAQLSREARTAYGLALGIVLASFLLRAVIDGRQWDAVWISPMGWLPELHAWGESRLGPLVALAGLTLACTVLAAVAALRRDLGGGLFASRPGPPTGPPALGRPLGFAWRLTRSAALGWFAVLVGWSIALGLLSVEMRDLVAANPDLLQVLGVARPEDVISTFAMVLASVGGAALGVHGVGRLAVEESTGRLGLVLATRTKRMGVWLVWTVLLVVEAVVVLIGSGLALGASSVLATGDGSAFGIAVGAGVQLAVAPTFITALAAVLHAFVPRAVGVAWLVVAWAAVVGVLAESLRLPPWSRALSPVDLIGTVPVEPASGSAIISLACAASGLLIAGAARVAHRDLLHG